MLIKFHSKAVAEILMLSQNAAPLLRAAGKSFGDDVPERGVFTCEQLQAAIDGIEAAVAADDRAHAGDDGDADHHDKSLHPVTQGVELHQRAFPLLDMMRRSLAEGADVTWEASKGW
ncbi:DUF1840 domain-containing protein [Bordetella petrii]|uniref:DUF1840 domain-containing protein n=1 Tax=Bordetella petrii TaxID=94624 RepID=UPI001A9751E8|nr:DUF1840 domain-containing protein [Bordetella petrii]MBO1114578.1 DUF1840 domain-containing protein [Bordetella petrii]